MANKDATVVVAEEQQPEQAEAVRGHEPSRTQPKRGKSKVGESPTDPLERRIRALERSLSTQETLVGELSEQLDNVAYLARPSTQRRLSAARIGVAKSYLRDRWYQSNGSVLGTKPFVLINGEQGCYCGCC
ncbi:hypothetical protein JCGZ_22953 [Jatropha curcas]|uniref:Uncharacterized protein n=1 Tax=Jatropha curcas TaxID=180498 RepID=A0A067LHF8_JATCU|nr:hypothetical protein JCGZ_22953 [Jatropha curcas]